MITLRTFASGDTDYIAKLNQNSSTIKAAIDQLQAQAGAAGGGGGSISIGTFLGALFNSADALIGPSSYVPSQSGSTLTVSPGAMYRQSTQSVVNKLTSSTLSFVAQPTGTYYVVIDSAGLPNRSSTFLDGTVYSVQWNGVAFFGEPIRVAPCFYDTAEATASRSSLIAGEFLSPPDSVEFPTLDARLEATESATAGTRKIGCTIDNTTGLKGAIQIDFAGTIIGWSIIADVAGTVQVEVSRAPSSPPPAAPGIPNPTTQKISASAPIALSAAISASAGEAGVSTWDVDLDAWDVIQFNVASVSFLTRATLYLRIQQG
jgi:hypothetical protein